MINVNIVKKKCFDHDDRMHEGSIFIILVFMNNPSKHRFGENDDQNNHNKILMFNRLPSLMAMMIIIYFY